MNIQETHIPGLLVIRPDVYGDSRGYFFESFSARKFEEMTGINAEFVQDNESRSSYGVVRGLHMQLPPHSQAKLVRVVEGRVLDVAVDLRTDSPTFGRHFSIELSGENHLQVYIPKGFAHGFSVLSESAVFQYKCDEYYAPGSEAAIAWDDQDLNIDWKVPAEDVVLSAKDRNHPAFKEFISKLL
jgi:dTDP-4-dehydrorhamnose 3,5-epimerase